jgi:hypothetical protein
VNLAALILTAIVATAALWTVRLAYRAIGLAKDSAVDAEKSARSGEAAAEAAAKTALEVGLARTRDRLVSDRQRFFGLLEQVEELQGLQRIVTGLNDPRWIRSRNLLSHRLAGSEDTFPLANAVCLASNPSTARIQDARIELNEALRAIEARIYVLDFG